MIRRTKENKETRCERVVLEVHVLRPQTVIREPACPFRAQTDLLTMHYSLWFAQPNPKGQVGSDILITVCGRNEEERPALSSHAHTTNERRCTTRASRSILSLATTDRDTRASLSLPSSNYSEFMIALKFADNALNLMRTSLFHFSCPRYPITVCSRNEVERPAHTSHTRRTNEGAKRDASEPFLWKYMLWPQNVERVSLSFPSSNFSHGTSHRAVILRLKFGRPIFGRPS